MLKGKTIRVEAVWDKHRFGLQLAMMYLALAEADTSEQLIKKLQVLIPELLQANGLINEHDPLEIPLHLLSKRTEMIKSRVHING